MVYQLVPQTQHVTSLLMTINKPLSAVRWLAPSAAVASLAMTLAFHDQLFCGCELRPIYYHNSHFESAINLEGNF